MTFMVFTISRTTVFGFIGEVLIKEVDSGSHYTFPSIGANREPLEVIFF